MADYYVDARPNKAGFYVLHKLDACPSAGYGASPTHRAVRLVHQGEKRGGSERVCPGGWLLDLYAGVPSAWRIQVLTVLTAPCPISPYLLIPFSWAAWAPWSIASSSPWTTANAGLHPVGFWCRLRLRLFCHKRPVQVHTYRALHRSAGGIQLRCRETQERTGAQSSLSRLRQPAVRAERGPRPGALRGHRPRGMAVGPGRRRRLDGETRCWNVSLAIWSAISTARFYSTTWWTSSGTGWSLAVTTLAKLLFR